MKRVLLAFLVLMTTACSSSRGRSLQAALEDGQEALRLGDTAAALARTDDALKPLAAADGSEAAWRLRLLRAEILITRRDFGSARTIVDHDIPQIAALAAVRARQKYLDARIALTSNDFARAFAGAAAARALAPADPDIQIDADVLEGQADLLQRAWDTADAVLTRALDQASARNDRHRELLCLNNLGMCRLLRGRYDEALVFFERALALSSVEKTAAYALVLSNAGICYSRLGQFDRAMDVQQKAVAALRARGNSKAVMEALGSLGNTHVLKGDARGALPFLNEAFSTANGARLADDAATWAVNLAAANASLGDWDAAERFNERGRAVEDAAAVRQVYIDLNAAQIAAGRGDRRR